jgi:hypothetical protein
MPDRRKPPLEPYRRASTRPEAASLNTDSDSLDFSIESTTMRLKSLRLRRAEVADREVSDAIKPASTQGSLDMPRGGPSGRVRHDERGVAVWDWAVATGEFAALSTTRALKKLEVADLKIEDHKSGDLKLQAAGRDKAGGFDPYNQRGSGKREGESASRAGVTGSASRDRAMVLDQLTGKKK